MKLSIGALGLSLALGAALAQKPYTPPISAEDSASSQPAPNTRTFKGELVGISCAGTVTAGTPQSATQRTGEANRSAGGDTHQPCALSASDSEFALRTKDGRTLDFDAVGNTRAQDALRSHKRWEKRAAAGKPVEVVVDATEEGNRLTVVSIEPREWEPSSDSASR